MPEYTERGYPDGGLLRLSLITGHATASTLTGITTEDKLIFVGHASTAASIATFVDYTSGSTISAANTVTWAATTASDQMWVWWWDVSPPETGTATPPLDLGYSPGYNIKCGLGTGTTAATNITLTGITTACKILHANLMQTKAAIETFTDDTANITITAADTIQSATDTSNDQLFVVWLDPAPATTAYSGSWRLKVDIVAGTTAVTNIAVTSITTKDVITSVTHWSTTAAIATCVDLTSEASITSDGNIQLATTDTSSDSLLVVWLDMDDVD